MSMPSALGIAAVFVLVLANGFFVATEFAIVAVRRSRLDQLAAEGSAGARPAQQIVGHLDTYIAACQLGITMASLGLGWVGEPALAHLVQGAMEALAGVSHPLAEHGVAVGISFALITALHIVAGELAPKGLALQKPEGTTLWVARPMRVFEFIFRWPIWLLNGVGNSVLRLFGLHPASGHEAVHSVEELRLLVHATQQAGGVEASEARIASRAFTFADRTAGALMTPRTEVDAIPLDLPLDALRTYLAGSPHTRLPVYESSLDHVVGVLYVAEFYKALDRALAHALTVQPATAGTVGAHLEAIDVRRLLRPAMIVPQSKPADDLLDEMRASGRYFSVVLDEYGGTAGIVTIEDLLEALVGPMTPEQQVTEGVDEPTPAIAAAPDGSLLVDGLVRLDEWEEATGLRLGPADHAAVETIGGLVMARLGRIPEAGDEVHVAGRSLRVEQMDGKRVAALRLLPVAPGREDTVDGPPTSAASAA